MSSRKYRKHTLALLAITAAALLVCAAAFSFKRDASVAVQGAPEQSHLEYYSPNAASSQENEKTSSPAPSRPSSGTSSSEKEEEYLITIHEGKIGVFRGRERSPFLTADINVYLLPAEDVNILRRGIRVRGFSAVKSVLEDYE